MKLLGIVIIYYPDIDLNMNIASYLNEVEALIIWDNTPKNDFKEVVTLTSNKIIYMGVGCNVGIGYALNEAVNFAIKNGYTHLLTMDQDSKFEEGNILDYKYRILQLSNSEIACYSVNYSGGGVGGSVMEVETSITSGSIYPVHIFSDIGLFRTDFFIDSIDTEFCLRARAKGYKVLLIPSVRMEHKLGYLTYYPFLWGRLGTMNYSAVRTYYMVRNLLILKKEYKTLPKIIEKSLRSLFCNRLVRIFLVEEDKQNKIKFFFKGIYDGLRNRTGNYKCQKIV